MTQESRKIAAPAPLQPESRMTTGGRNSPQLNVAAACRGGPLLQKRQPALQKLGHITAFERVAFHNRHEKRRANACIDLITNAHFDFPLNHGLILSCTSTAFILFRFERDCHAEPKERGYSASRALPKRNKNARKYVLFQRLELRYAGNLWKTDLSGKEKRSALRDRKRRPAGKPGAFALCVRGLVHTVFDQFGNNARLRQRRGIAQV